MVAAAKLFYDMITLEPHATASGVERFLSEYLLARARMIEVKLITPFDSTSESAELITIKQKMGTHSLVKWV